MLPNSLLSYALVAFLILQFSTQISSIKHTKPLPRHTNTQYIKISCTNTTYPRLCYRSLSIYATKINTNPKLLVNIALNVTLKNTKSTSRLMKKLRRNHGLRHREAAALVDCVELVGDSVYELERSIGEMGKAKGSKLYQVIDDIQTWVSAALTNDDTCMDGFEEVSMNRKVKTIARKHITKIAHLTSNALALVNHFASSYTNSNQ